MGSRGSVRSIHQRNEAVHALDVLYTSPKRWPCMRKSHAHRCLLNDTPRLPLTDVKLPWMVHTCRPLGLGLGLGRSAQWPG